MCLYGGGIDDCTNPLAYWRCVDLGQFVGWAKRSVPINALSGAMATGLRPLPSLRVCQLEKIAWRVEKITRDFEKTARRVEKITRCFEKITRPLE